MFSYNVQSAILYYNMYTTLTHPFFIEFSIIYIIYNYYHIFVFYFGSLPVSVLLGCSSFFANSHNYSFLNSGKGHLTRIFLLPPSFIWYQ